MTVASSRPAATRHTPLSITTRGPCASMTRPTIGLRTAETRKPKEKAPAARPRSQPNSSISGGNSSEKAVRALDADRHGHEGDADDQPAVVERQALRPVTGFTCVGQTPDRCVERRLAARRPLDVVGDQRCPRLEHALGPARDVRGHDHVAELVEGLRRRQGRPGRRGIAIPDIEGGAGELAAGTARGRARTSSTISARATLIR